MALTISSSNTTKKKPGDPGYDPLVDGDANVFSGLKTGGEGYLENAYRTIGSQVSGEAYQPYKTAAQQALSRSASNLRASTGSAFAPAIGQGSAVRAQQATEQNIMRNVSDTALGMAQGEQEMKNKGISNLIGMRQQMQSEQGQKFNQEKSNEENANTENWKAYEAALIAGDFGAAGSKYKEMTGITLNMDQLKLAQSNINKKASQEIRSGELSIGSQEYNDIQNMVNTGASIDQINARYPNNYLTADQYNSMKAASDTTYRINKLASDETLQRLGIASGEKIAGMNISSNEKISGMQITSAEKLAGDKNWLEQQGINLQEAALYGYQDANDNFVPGSIQIAAQRFGLEADTLALQKTEINKKYDLLSNEDKRAADSFYGYDTKDANGKTVHHLGSAELAENAQDIQKQGLSLDEAQLYGFDKDGTHIPGNLEVAARTLDLNGRTVQAQTDEVYGYYNKDGSYVPGKLSTMSAEAQDRAKGLYGYTDPTTGEHVKGSMELNQDNIQTQNEVARGALANDIEQTQGTLSLQDRQVRIQEKSADSDAYWNSAKRFSTYVSTHLNANETDAQVRAEAAQWYKAQFGVDPDITSPQFNQFVKQELAAAKDGRLTNPIDQTIYTINSSSLDADTKAKMVAYATALPQDTKFSTDSNGNVVMDSGENSWNPDLTYDATNTYASHPSMFAKDGGVWTGNAQAQGLTNGQKITLGDNFGVESSSISIPKGNYIVMSTTINRNGQVDKRTLLKSEDGTKFYPTDYYNSGGKQVVMPGYTWNEKGGYYTENNASVATSGTPQANHRTQ
jgi:hypothetical protein